MIKTVTHDAYLCLGTNIDERQHHLDTALFFIESRIGHIIMKSDVLETEPWGFASPNKFLNMVVCVQTEQSPSDLLKLTQTIEREMGRDKKTGTDGCYADRIIDIDILLLDDMVVATEDLTIPHPLMLQRLFVLKPLAQIAPELIHPVARKSIISLLAECGKE